MLEPSARPPCQRKSFRIVQRLGPWHSDLVIKGSYKLHAARVDARLAEMANAAYPGEQFSCAAIGEFCGVTKQCINRIEIKAIRKIRAQLDRWIAAGKT